MKTLLAIAYCIFALAGCSDYSDESQNNLTVSNETIKINNDAIIINIQSRHYEDPVRTKFHHDLSISIGNAYADFDYALRSYEQKHPAEIRLISYKQLYAEYEKSMLTMVSAHKAILNKNNYYYPLNIKHPNRTYLNCPPDKRDDECINNMRNEIYTNSNKLLFTLRSILPLICRF